MMYECVSGLIKELESRTHSGASELVVLLRIVDLNVFVLVYQSFDLLSDRAKVWRSPPDGGPVLVGVGNDLDHELMAQWSALSTTQDWSALSYTYLCGVDSLRKSNCTLLDVSSC